ncbi:MAG: hypothetical protein V3V16_13055 [Melioribacteraceae bacterium]
MQEKFTLQKMLHWFEDGISSLGDNIFVKYVNSELRLRLALEGIQLSNDTFVKAENKFVSMNIDL